MFTRHETEEAVENARQLLTTMRGIRGLVEICEISLNHTKIVDGLEERKVILEKEIAKLELDKLSFQTKTDEFHASQENEYLKRIQNLKQEETKHKERMDRLNLEYGDKKNELDRKHSAELSEFNAWMNDCQQKQIAANESLTVVTRQLDAIRSKLG